MRVSKCFVNIGVNIKFFLPFFSEFFSLEIISFARFNWDWSYFIGSKFLLALSICDKKFIDKDSFMAISVFLKIFRPLRIVTNDLVSVRKLKLVLFPFGFRI